MASIEEIEFAIDDITKDIDYILDEIASRKIEVRELCEEWGYLMDAQEAYYGSE